MLLQFHIGMILILPTQTANTGAAVREGATRQKDRKRWQQAVDKAQAALDKAEREYAKRAAAIQAEMEALEKRSQGEDAGWKQERGRLEKALRRARD